MVIEFGLTNVDVTKEINKILESFNIKVSIVKTNLIYSYCKCNTRIINLHTSLAFGKPFHITCLKTNSSKRRGRIIYKAYYYNEQDLREDLLLLWENLSSISDEAIRQYPEINRR